MAGRKRVVRKRGSIGKKRKKNKKPQNPKTKKKKRGLRHAAASFPKEKVGFAPWSTLVSTAIKRLTTARRHYCLQRPLCFVFFSEEKDKRKTLPPLFPTFAGAAVSPEEEEREGTVCLSVEVERAEKELLLVVAAALLALRPERSRSASASVAAMEVEEEEEEVEE